MAFLFDLLLYLGVEWIRGIRAVKFAKRTLAVWPVICVGCYSRSEHVYKHLESRLACSAESRLINLQCCQGPLSSADRWNLHFSLINSKP